MNEPHLNVQIIEWDFYDKPVFNIPKLSDDYAWGEKPVKEGRTGSKFVISGFGVNELGESITVNIHDFPPHFYIGLPSFISNQTLDMFITKLKDKMPYYCRNDIDDNYDIVKKKKFYGFDNDIQHNFIRILFKSYKGLKACSKILEEDFIVPGFKIKRFELYESNIPPLLRFIHYKNIKPASWITFSKQDIINSNESLYNTNHEYNINWKHINTLNTTNMAPFKIASYDIECDSSHGDFPLPKKSYSKLAREIIQHISTNTDDIKTHIRNDITEAFSKNKCNHISKIFTKDNSIPSNLIINIVTLELYNIYKKKESYMILALDILLHYNFNLLNIKHILEDAFCEYTKIENKHFNDVFSIYTKQNNKPSKKCIDNLYIKINSILTKFIQLDKYIHIKDIIQNLDLFNKLSIEQQYNEYDNNSVNRINQCLDQLVIMLQQFLPTIDDSKETIIKRFDNYMVSMLPDVAGDKIIQIGTVIQKYGDDKPYIKHILTLGGCDPIEGCIVEQFDSERELLLKWSEFILKNDPDIITGYNILGFDYTYMVERAEELDCLEEFSKLSRKKGEKCDLVNKQLSSSALGDNTLRYLNMTGRVQMDLLKIIQRDHNLNSYKLDFVAEHFITNSVTSYNNNKIKIKGIDNLSIGNFITFNNDKTKYKDGKKFMINDINYDTQELYINDSITDSITHWTLCKDDVTPNDIFKYQKGSDADRRIIAKYCIQDCVLCLHIINSLKIITNNIAMANVCWVPLSFIFLRGQGIKVFSLVSKECGKENYLIRVIKYTKNKTIRNNKFSYSNDEDINTNLGFEGAGVLQPKKGIYLDKYTVVLDFSSLYPSCIISENISHDSLCIDKKYLGKKGETLIHQLGLTFKDITYSIYKWVDSSNKNKGKIKIGEKVSRFIQYPNKKSILGSIESKLLYERKIVKQKMVNECDETKKQLLDGEQLAIKLTCNSLYGQLGAETSPICLVDLAASVTATGRKLLYMAKTKIQNKFKNSDVLYGDTDSVFIDFKPTDKDGNLLTGKDGLKKAIELGIEAEKYVQKYLEKPHKLEYEKTFWPFILFSKKRYIGHKYETDINKFKETSMGIVLKRRDNANIVKYMYSKVINNIMVHKNIEKSIIELRSDIKSFINGEFPSDMLIITKTLKSTYKNPNQISHYVLSERIAKRDPGNRPMVNDRIPYIYIDTKTKSTLQGDRIEHPDYIEQMKLNPDYKFYITNQIMKPIGQIYALIIEQLKEYRQHPEYYNNKLVSLMKTNTPEKANTKISELKLKDTNNIIFGNILLDLDNKKKKVSKITNFFTINHNKNSTI